jgi:hypothetical protein
MLHSAKPSSYARTTSACAAALLFAVSLGARDARAQAEESAATPPQPTKTVGGHVGIAVPFVTFSKQTKSVSDQFTILDPIGIGFKVSKHVAMDFETIVGTPIHPTGTTSFVVDPGVIFGFGRVALGLRIAFQINADANIGLIPLVNYGLVDLGGATWFIEGALPTFYQDKEVALSIVGHTGVAF